MNDVMSAHNNCRNNLDALKDSDICGCFYCLELFDPKFIHEWCDGEQTAVCPHCGIDSILAPSENYKLDKNFLSTMNQYWFSTKA